MLYCGLFRNDLRLIQKALCGFNMQVFHDRTIDHRNALTGIRGLFKRLYLSLCKRDFRNRWRKYLIGQIDLGGVD